MLKMQIEKLKGIVMENEINVDAVSILHIIWSGQYMPQLELFEIKSLSCCIVYSQQGIR